MQGMAGVSIGISGGLIAAWAATHVVANFIYGVEPHDAMTFTVTTIVLSSVAAVACAVPAFRAALVDPVVTLRAE